ncbi:MAG: hypothetical protein PHS33_07835 [Candidatus Omnitrophica bacterium]|nr:hypothetical protein [Candidatus Omnitrophota bacterium]
MVKNTILILLSVFSLSFATTLTKTVKTGGDYSRLGEAWAANEDMTQDTIIFYCDTCAVGFSDSGFHADGYADAKTEIITVSDRCRSYGLPDTSKYNINSQIVISVAGIIIEGVYLRPPLTVHAISDAGANRATRIAVVGCLVQTISAIGMDMGGDSRNFRVISTIFYDTNAAKGYNAIYEHTNASADWGAYNCVFVNYDNAVRHSYGNARIINCGIYASTADSLGPGTFAEWTTNSHDTPKFVDSANYDYHIASDDAVWVGNGTDLSDSFTVDIDSTAIGTPWCIGANWISSCTPTAITYTVKTDTIGKPGYLTHTFTKNDLDSFVVVDDGGDSIKFVNYTNSDSIYYEVRSKEKHAIHLRKYSCETSTDWYDSLTGVDEVLEVLGHSADTAYSGDSVQWYFERYNPIADIDSAFMGDSDIVFYDSVGDTIGGIIPSGIDTGEYPIAFHVGTQSDTDTIYFAGLYDTATITLDPHDTTASNGQTVIFHIDATSSGTLSYQWQADAGGGWGNLGGETNNTLTWAVVTAENGYLYRCIATDARGADTSTAATLTVSETIYTVTVTDAGNGSTDPVGGQAVADGDSIQIIAIPDANYHFMRWTRSATDVVPTDSSNDTTMVTANGNGTMTAVFVIDTFAITLSDDAHTTLSCKTDCIGSYGELDTVILSVDAGWQGFWPGGDGVTGNDTLIVTVTKDSTVTAASYVIPVIDSIKAHTRRDLNRISCARRLDTVTFITATDIYDSTDQGAVFIGRDTTGQMTITRWFNSGSGLDSIWAIVPADATANKNFRPILRNGYGICSNVRTPVTWREPWILNVKVMVP